MIVRVRRGYQVLSSKGKNLGGALQDARGGYLPRKTRQKKCENATRIKKKPWRTSAAAWAPCGCPVIRHKPDTEAGWRLNRWRVEWSRGRRSGIGLPVLF